MSNMFSELFQPKKWVWFRRALKSFLFLFLFYIGLHYALEWFGVNTYHTVHLDEVHRIAVDDILDESSDDEWPHKVHVYIANVLGISQPCAIYEAKVDKIKRILGDSIDSFPIYFPPDTLEDLIQNHLDTSLNHKFAIDSVFACNGDSDIHSSIALLVSTYSKKELKKILPKYGFKIKGFFWLSGSWLYIEILFWTIFGIFASMFFVSSESIVKGTFDDLEGESFLARLIYGPMTAIIIILGYNALFSDNGIFLTSSSKVIIIVSFILGFFSARMMELLRRLRDIFLPLASIDKKSGSGSTGDESASSLSGFVSNADGTFSSSQMSSVAISIMDAGGTVRKQNADEKGYFRFTDLSPGEYEISAMVVIDDEIYSGVDLVDYVPNVTKPLHLTLRPSK